MKKNIAHNRFRPLAGRTLLISRYTVLEAWRNRFGLLLISMVVASVLVSFFVRQQAITEADRVQLATLASIMRIGSVFLIAVHVLQGSVREFQDKILELMLSLDLPRASYLSGKLLGHMSICAASAVIVSLPLFLLADPQSVFLWTYTLVLEMWVVSAIALFCVTTFSQFLPAASFVLAFYLLARSISAIQLISHSSLTTPGMATDVAQFLAQAISLVLPRLDAFAQTAWLTHSAAAPLSITTATAQAGIYVGLLLMAGIFDLHRRNL